MENLILIGGGGHCKSVLDCLDRTRFEQVIISDRSERIGGAVLDVPVLINDEQLPQMREQGFDCAFISLGTIRAGTARKQICERLICDGYRLINIISDTAVVSGHAKVDFGVFIGKRAMVNAGATIGCCAIVNSGAIVEHDCEIGAFTHIAPGCVLSGGVRIGECSHIGTGAIIRQGVRIGSGVTVGAGSVVLRDVPDHTVSYGVPSKVVK